MGYLLVVKSKAFIFFSFVASVPSPASLVKRCRHLDLIVMLEGNVELVDVAIIGAGESIYQHCNPQCDPVERYLIAIRQGGMDWWRRGRI